MLKVLFQSTLKAKLQFMHGHNQCNLQVTGHGLLTKVVTFVHNVAMELYDIDRDQPIILLFIFSHYVMLQCYLPIMFNIMLKNKNCGQTIMLFI